MCGSAWATRRAPPIAAPRWGATGSTTRCWTPRHRAPSRCTTCPRTPARRSPRRFSMALVSASGTRPEPPSRAEGSARASDRARGLAAMTPDSTTLPDTPSDERSHRPQRGDELELQIDSLAFGGEGVARLGDGGYVVFVAGAIPGDRVRAVVHKRKRSYAHARTLEGLEPSPERIAPTAAHPGVAWQVLPYERQLEIKRGQVDDALRRIGRLDGFELEEIVPAVEPWRYRNKLEYSFGNDGLEGDEGEEGELVCGFHVPAGGNRVAPIRDCLLASERGNLAREVTLRWCRAQGLTAWDRGGGGRVASVGEHGSGRDRGGRDRGRRGGAEQARRDRTSPAPDGRARLRNLVVREGRHSGRLQVRIVTTDGELEAGSLAAALSEALGDDLA